MAPKMAERCTVEHSGDADTWKSPRYYDVCGCCGWEGMTWGAGRVGDRGSIRLCMSCAFEHDRTACFAD